MSFVAGLIFTVVCAFSVEADIGVEAEAVVFVLAFDVASSGWVVELACFVETRSRVEAASEFGRVW